MNALYLYLKVLSPSAKLKLAQGCLSTQKVQAAAVASFQICHECLARMSLEDATFVRGKVIRNLNMTLPPDAQ